MNRFPTAALVATMLVLALLGAGCAAAPAPPPRPAADAAPASAPRAPAPGGAQSAGSAPTEAEASQERMVIRTAYLRLVVADVDEVLGKAADLAREMGGYVVSSESQEQGGERVGKATLRVVSERMDEALARLKQMAIRTGRETTGAKDVTEEYVDQDARLRTLRATEDQYLQLLKRANTMDEILKVQQPLNQVREQIERTEGRMQFLRRSADTAVINLELTTAAAARPMAGSGWSPQEAFSEALRALVATLALVAGLAIWVAVFAPLWGPAALLSVWWARRRPARTTAPPPTPAPAPPAPPAA